MFVQKTATTYELYQNNDKNQNLNKQYFYKTFLKVGKMRVDQFNEQSIPFIIEWIPNLYQKSQIGELTIRFEFGHLRPNETIN